MSQAPRLAASERPRRRGLRHLPAALGLLALGLLALAATRPRLRVPRDPAVIARVTGSGPHAGDCGQCHTTHGDSLPTVYPNTLTAPDDNALCLRCHAVPWQGGSLASGTLYRGSSHGGSLAMVWPGPDPPLRIEPDAPTKCLNCHDPHGWADGDGAVPHLMLAREERLCLTCHDGAPAATNVALDLAKPYRHPVTDFTGRHAGPGESQPSEFATAPGNLRHAECDDCHNSHVARADRTTPLDDDASATTLGVSRVAVLNGPAGSAPSYTFIPGADTLNGARAEYELCFKCHSSWTTQPAGQTDLARALNPANASFHPVEAEGRNPTVASAAFAPGWSATARTRCGDCHGSDFGTVRGPHGSIHPHLLRSPYPDSPLPRTMASDELCFRCHNQDVYANPTAPEGVRAASRFNGPAVAAGHAEHVGAQQTPCYACHVTHGAATQPFLIATDRVPGIVSYTATATGGTCASTCHDPKTYAVNYAR